MRSLCSIRRISALPRGKDGAIYAFCMNVPESGGTVSIHSLGESSGLSVKRVSLLGYPGDLLWSQTASSLSISYPSQSADLSTSVVFRIEAK